MAPARQGGEALVSPLPTRGLALCISAWNLFRRGQGTGKLAVRTVPSRVLPEIA